MAFILASGSSFRQKLLNDALIPFETILPRIDEQNMKDALVADGASSRDIADTLAEMKARKVAAKHPEDYVLGCDQVLEFNGEIRGKPLSKSQLVTWFQDMRGEKHSLLTANVLYHQGKPIWRHLAKTDLWLADLSDQAITTYVDSNWDAVQNCAGGYMFEVTPHIFERIKGNVFDIMGLSLPQVAGILRQHKVIAPDHPDMKLAAVLGHPIAQSKSPLVHGHWLKTLDIPGDYIKIDIPPDRFSQTVQMLFDAGFSGFNVTIPHKSAAFDLGQNIKPAARSIGVSNTLYKTDGKIVADNTDATGFYSHLIASVPDFSAQGKTVLVLGAGGAASAVLWAFREAGASQIILTNRTKATAETQAHRFGDTISVVEWGARHEFVAQADVIVNTTALGMTNMPALDLDLTELREGTVVYDLVYNPLETDLLANARTKGAICVDGLGMLLHQAVPGFEAWFGKKPSVSDALRDIVLS